MCLGQQLIFWYNPRYSFSPLSFLSSIFVFGIKGSDSIQRGIVNKNRTWKKQNLEQRCERESN